MELDLVDFGGLIGEQGPWPGPLGDDYDTCDVDLAGFTRPRLPNTPA